MSKPLNKLKKYFFQPSSSSLSTNYLNLIENILKEPTKTIAEKQVILQKILKIITNKIQIQLNESVLFYGAFESTHKVSLPTKIIPFELTDYPDEIQPFSFSINKVPFFSYVWRDDRLLQTFSIIGKEGFDFNKQDNPENVVIHPLGIVIGFGNNHSTNAGLLDNSGESKVNYTLTLSQNQISQTLKNPKINYECDEIKLLLEIAQLFISYNFSITIK